MAATNRMIASDANDQDRLMSLLAYIIGWIVSVIILVTDMKNRPFQRFHAVNALAFDVAAYVIVIVLCICINVGAIILSNIPVLGGILGIFVPCLTFIVVVAWLVLRIWYGVLAYQGNYFDIPFVTNFCRQQRWI